MPPDLPALPPASRSLIVAKRQCETCPFKGADDAYKKSCAGIPAEDWPCHTADLVYGNHASQCRGHWKAQRKYPNEPRPEVDDDVIPVNTPCALVGERGE